MRRDGIAVIAFMAFTFGIVIGSALQDYWVRPVIVAQGVEIVEQQKLLQIQNERLVWQSGEIISFKDQIGSLQKDLDASASFIMKAGVIYKTDFKNKMAVGGN